MYIQEHTKKVGDKVYNSTLLVESYRKGKKVRHRTLANLSKWDPLHVEALRAALRGDVVLSIENIELDCARNFGALYSLSEIADRIGITSALGEGVKGRRSLLMALGIAIAKGSKLSISRWADTQATNEVLCLPTPISEDSLYRAMDWLEAEKDRIEDEIFEARHPEGCTLFLYDVTSTYLEGEKNEYAAYGYNRDKKKGKKQIVVGLLTDPEGFPVSVELFRGNTQDPQTLTVQIQKLARRFRSERIVLVGDGGMVKSLSEKEIKGKDWAYITSITKTQIGAMLKSGELQMSLFDEDVQEVLIGENRYVLRRNPQRAKDVARNRRERLDKVRGKLDELAHKLATSKRKSPKKTYESAVVLIAKLKVQGLISVDLKERTLSYSVDEDAIAGAEALDGCYAIKTNLTKREMSAAQVHDRYRDLGKVEQAFRTMKSGLLDIRPVNHRKRIRTRAHAVLYLLSEMIVHELSRLTEGLDLSREQIIWYLDAIPAVTVSCGGVSIRRTVNPDENQKPILRALDVIIPKMLGKPVVAATASS